MIKEIKEDDIAECVDVIRRSFYTVAEELGFTIDNAPRFSAFATTQDRLLYQLKNEHRQMYAYCENYDKIIGYYNYRIITNVNSIICVFFLNIATNISGQICLKTLA